MHTIIDKNGKIVHQQLMSTAFEGNPYNNISNNNANEIVIAGILY